MSDSIRNKLNDNLNVYHKTEEILNDPKSLIKNTGAESKFGGSTKSEHKHWK